MNDFIIIMDHFIFHTYVQLCTELLFRRQLIFRSLWCLHTTAAAAAAHPSLHHFQEMAAVLYNCSLHRVKVKLHMLEMFCGTINGTHWPNLLLHSLFTLLHYLTYYETFEHVWGMIWLSWTHLSYNLTWGEQRPRLINENCVGRE